MQSKNTSTEADSERHVDIETGPKRQLVSLNVDMEYNFMFACFLYIMLCYP